MDNFNQEDADKLRGIKALKKVKELIEALTKLALDPKAAPKAKALAIACLLYVISPLDAIPDVLPVVGWSDDIALIVATVSQLAVELKPYMPAVALGALLTAEYNTPKRENNITVEISPDEKTVEISPDEKTVEISPDEKTVVIPPDEKTVIISPDEKTVVIPPDEETSNTTLIEQLKRFQIIMTATLILLAIVVISSLVFNAFLMGKLTHH
ncbi:MAG TPA: hypothetical protein DCY88_18725 [Cyanobacteria bacterium UBA11372]|nr:hypothetical protein [Cyanobacteria bacterium UBA11372]